MFICKICGLVYNLEPAKCLNDGYSDFIQITEHIPSPTIQIRFSSKQENLFHLMNFPVDFSDLDPINRFYYGFAPNVIEFPIKLKIKDIFSKDELIFNNFDDKAMRLDININADKSSTLYRYFFKSKDKREFEEINSKQVSLFGLPSDEGNFDELRIKNLSIKFIGLV